MINTYGLTMSPKADPAAVDRALNENAGHIMGVLDSLIGGVNDMLDQHGQHLDYVASRLTKSIGGHLSRNTDALQQAANAITSHVNSALAENDGVINAVAAHPAVAAYLRSVPVAASILATVPVAPPNTSSTARPPALPGVGSPSAPLPPSESGEQPQTYSLWRHAETGDVRLVPATVQSLQASGWTPPPGYTALRELSLYPSTAANVVAQQLPQILSV
jgi:hypothetical protein